MRVLLQKEKTIWQHNHQHSQHLRPSLHQRCNTFKPVETREVLNIGSSHEWAHAAYFNFLFDEMMSDFLNFDSLILISFASLRSSMVFRIACDFASIRLKISSWRSSLSLSATRESTSTRISFTKCIAFSSFSCSTLSSTELFNSGWINSGYFVRRWVTKRMHSGIPFFFNKGFCRQCLYHSAKLWSSVMIHLKVFNAERWFEQNSPEEESGRKIKLNSINKLADLFYTAAIPWWK